MRTFKRMICVGLLSASVLGCGDGGGGRPDAATSDAAPDATGCVCDPVGANAEQSALLNAPLEAGVEVLDREPRHPGCAGPDNLP